MYSNADQARIALAWKLGAPVNQLCSLDRDRALWQAAVNTLPPTYLMCRQRQGYAKQANTLFGDSSLSAIFIMKEFRRMI